MKVALYLRVSTDEQTIDNQMPSLTNLVRQRGWQIHDIYQEQASAWRVGHQKELARLMEDARKGKFEAVIVWALDRLTREGVAGLILMIERFNKYGVKVISLQEGWTEYPNEFTPVFLAMMGFFAKYESDRRSERTKAGLERARNQGIKLGRPKGKKL